MIQTSGVRQLHYGNLHKIAAFSFLLRSVMPTSGISKFSYDFWCPNRALDNSTINLNQSSLN